MTTNNHTYRLRPGRWSDTAATVRVYCAAFRNESLVDMLFSNRHEHPVEFREHIYHLFEERYWSPDWLLTMAVDENDYAVGFTWWRRPKDEFSFLYRWLSPYSWFSAFMRKLFTLKNFLFPLRNIDQESAGMFTRALDTVKPELFKTTRREQAWYLSALAVDPAVQGKGLASMLIHDGVGKAEQRGKASWLISVKGVEGLYSRFGFIGVARANVGELSKWDGGLIMFKE